MNWAGKCPHWNESVNMFEAKDNISENSDSEEDNIVLLTDSNLKNCIFVSKAWKSNFYFPENFFQIKILPSHFRKDTIICLFGV